LEDTIEEGNGVLKSDELCVVRYAVVSTCKACMFLGAEIALHIRTKVVGTEAELCGCIEEDLSQDRTSFLNADTHGRWIGGHMPCQLSEKITWKEHQDFLSLHQLDSFIVYSIMTCFDCATTTKSANGWR
jgi:hypothetical protein